MLWRISILHTGKTGNGANKGDQYALAGYTTFVVVGKLGMLIVCGCVSSRMAGTALAWVACTMITVVVVQVLAPE